MRLIYFALAWCAGIVFLGDAELPIWAWTALTVYLTFNLWLVRHTRDWPTISILLLAYVLGGWRMALVADTSDVATYNNTGGLTIAGDVAAAPDVRDDGTRLIVEARQVIRSGNQIATQGRVLVYAPRTADVAYGDRIQATGSLIIPGEYDTFSYADYLGREGVFSIMDNAAVTIVSSDHGNPLLRALYDLRERTQSVIADGLPEPQAGLLTGILLGNERGISPELEDDFSTTGTSHIIAISGFNMVIIAAFVMQGLQRLTRRDWLAAVLGAMVIGIYTLFVGANPAVVRAAIMSVVLVVGQALKRKTYVPASLAFVAVIMSALDPDVLWSISFQLSFFATLGLALFADPLTKRFEALLVRTMPLPAARVTGGLLTEPVIVTLAALSLTLPLILLYFQRLSLVILVVNLLVVPIQAYVLILGGLATIIAAVAPVVGQVLFWFEYLLLSWTIGVVRVFARLPFAETQVRVDPLVVYSLFVVIVGWAMLHATQPEWWQRLVTFMRRQVVAVTMALSGAGLFMLMGIVAVGRPDGDLHVWFLEMGHSNAVLIQTPGGAQILVDGGRFPSRLLTAIGDRAPFTDREIELLIITHPDEFDISALTAVVERYDIGAVLTNGQPNQGAVYTRLQEALADAPNVSAVAGYMVEMDDGVLVEVLHPAERPTLSDDIGDNALVVRVSYGDVSFLLTSDLGVAGQRALIDNGAWPLATVLQLPDHATARSLDDDFLAAVQAQAVVVLVDPANRRGDPDPDVLSLLDTQTPLFRTDQGGVVHFWTDGERLYAEQAMD